MAEDALGCSIADFDLESEFIVAHRHPTLGVALCGACREACAEASADACTWCGQTHGIMWKCASAGKGAGAGDAPCQHMFCDDCAQLALPADRMRDDGSRCFVHAWCDPTPLAELQRALLDARARWSMAETAYRAAIAADLEHSSLPVEKQAVLVDRLCAATTSYDALARLEGCDEVAEARTRQRMDPMLPWCPWTMHGWADDSSFWQKVPCHSTVITLPLRLRRH